MRFPERFRTARFPNPASLLSLVKSFLDRLSRSNWVHSLTHPRSLNPGKIMEIMCNREECVTQSTPSALRPESRSPGQMLAILNFYINLNYEDQFNCLGLLINKHIKTLHALHKMLCSGMKEMKLTKLYQC